ncbi:hypothetical protein BDZ85DRAFT_280182 [Elsinoe ampelina]|uniref:DUF7702 domain-containing protein n=1 Tax=Elsinoe ampelina TaxID=302913 RepID=A0A6A6GH15_9PEZI|nr:hypothetical protein BDZ85DRAFT_280182 [Elsinoe ampelina]
MQDTRISTQLLPLLQDIKTSAASFPSTSAASLSSSHLPQHASTGNPLHRRTHLLLPHPLPSSLHLPQHGFRRADGWLYLILLSLIRLIGNSTGIAYVSHPTNLNLLACELICQTIGISPLLLVLLGLTNQTRVARPTPQSSSPPCKTTHPATHSKEPLLTRAAYLLVLLALILSVTAGTYSFSTVPSKVTLSHALARVGATLYLLAFLVTATIAFISWRRRHHQPRTNRVLQALVASLPFLGVRVVYGAVAAYDYEDRGTFGAASDTVRAVVVRAVLGFAMEAVVVGLCVGAGIGMKKVVKGGKEGEVVEVETVRTKGMERV